MVSHRAASEAQAVTRRSEDGEAGLREGTKNNVS